MDQPRPLFHSVLSFSNTLQIFTINTYVKNVHPVYGAGIQTHDLWNMILPPLLHQGSRPDTINCFIRNFREDNDFEYHCRYR